MAIFTSNINEINSLLETISKSKVRQTTTTEFAIIHENITRGSVFNRSIFEVLPIKTNYIKNTSLNGALITINEAESIVVPKKCRVILECLFTNSVIVLPCPEMGDTENNMHQQVVERSMNNRLYSYIRKNNLQKLHYSFVLGRGIAKDLQSFISTNVANIIDLINWKGERWRVNFTNNPFEFTAKSLFENEGEKYIVDLEFQGIRII
jgi:hypothetical protein